MKMSGGDRGRNPLILNLEAMWKWIINFMSHPLYHPVGWVDTRADLDLFEKKNLVILPRIEPQILQPVVRDSHLLRNNSFQIYCNTSFGFPRWRSSQTFLFNLGKQFYSCVFYMSCPCHVYFCHVIINSLFYVAYPYTKASQCLPVSIWMPSPHSTAL
jgi:hypothetical protein